MVFRNCLWMIGLFYSYWSHWIWQSQSDRTVFALRPSPHDSSCGPGHTYRHCHLLSSPCHLVIHGFQVFHRAMPPSKFIYLSAAFFRMGIPIRLLPQLPILSRRFWDTFCFWLLQSIVVNGSYLLFCSDRVRSFVNEDITRGLFIDYR